MYEPLSSKTKFACQLFDIDSDGNIGREDMKAMLHTKLRLKHKSHDHILTPEDIQKIQAELKQHPTVLSFPEFTQLLPKHIDVYKITKLFQVLPSPAQEYKIVLKAVKERKQSDMYYVVSNEWYRSWKLFLNNYVDRSELQKAEEESPMERSILSTYQSRLIPLERITTKTNPRHSSTLPTSTKEEEVFDAAISRPGKINNSELAGALPGSLKNGLMVVWLGNCVV
eukprot:TRINITY_DN10214_c0_g2_i1.p1 TRINITY_DN10214_c0_g2~~TRINITY_DN10214_c0_g2_i1.p1  ORF type:complete len:226 (+),score=61.89 TRINITY_DN10214_c0_g2_i1:377-1054(+)